MRTCEDYEELISARLDGALTDEERAALDAHLAGCPRCRRTAAELAQVDAALRSLGGAAPVDLTARVLDRIGAEKVVPLRRRPRRALWGAACAAVLALVLVAGSGLSLFPAAGDQACDTTPFAAQSETIGTDGTAPAEDSASAAPESDGNAKTADADTPSVAMDGQRGRPAQQEQQRPTVHGADGSDPVDGGDQVGTTDGQSGTTDGQSGTTAGQSGGTVSAAGGGGGGPRETNGTGGDDKTGQTIGGQSAADPLTEDDAAAALRAWLGAADAPLTALGPTADGGAWRFALDGRTFSVDAGDGTVTEEGTGNS